MKIYPMNMTTGIVFVCVVGLLFGSGCVSIHHDNQIVPAKDVEPVVVSPAQAEASVQAEAPVQVAIPAQEGDPRAVGERDASGQTDILRNSKKPCSAIADDACKFKKFKK